MSFWQKTLIKTVVGPTGKSQHRQEYAVLGMETSGIATGQNEALLVVSRCGG